MTLSTADFKRTWELSNELFHTDSVDDAIDILFDRGKTLFPFDPDLAIVSDVGHLSCNMGDLDKVAANYAARYHQLDPLNVLEKPHNLNRALRTLDVVSPGKHQQSEFYRDFSSPLGIETVLGVCAARGENPVCGIALHRGRNVSAFSEADRERLTLVAPSMAHSLHALQLRRATEQRFGDDGIGDGQGVAAWVFKPGTQHMRCNPEAERMLRNTGGRSSTHPWKRLPAAVQALVEPLMALPTPSGSAETRVPIADTVSCHSGNHWYAFTVTKLPAGECAGLNAPIVVTAVRRSSHYEIDERLRGLGLSERERQIAHLVTRGLTNKETANHLGIREQTVKDHLRPIFAKAGINSRTRFIARLIWGE